MSPDKLPIIFLGGLDDALLGGSSRAEAGYEGAILTTQYGNIRVRLVEVVVELGQPEFSHVSSSRFVHPEEVSATRVVGR
jgi:hypothetical protein